MDVKDLSFNVTKDFENHETLARYLLKVLICGSHGGGDKKHLTDLRDELRTETEFKIPGAFIMEEIGPDKKIDFHHKFELIWKRIKKGDSIPLCILYAGKTATTSQGLNAEIQNVAEDPEKMKYSYLIRHEDAKLVDHANDFIPHIVKSPEEFKKVAKSIIRAELGRITSYLINKEGGGKGGRI